MVFYKITIKEVKENFSRQIYYRGEHFNDNMDKEVKLRGGRISAIVQGSYHPYYQVWINIMRRHLKNSSFKSTSIDR